MRASVQFASPLNAIFRWLLWGGLIGLLLVGGAAPTAAQTDSAINIDFEVGETPILVPGQNILSVTMHVTGGSCPILKYLPIDLVILTDISTSMDTPFPDGVTRLEAARQGVRDFLNGLNLNNLGSDFDHAAVITYGDVATIRTQRQPTDEELELTPSPLTPESLAFIIDRNTIANSMTVGPLADGATLIDGLDMALAILDGLGRNLEGNAAPRLLIVTDGEDNPIEAAQAQAMVERMRRRIPGLQIAVQAIASPTVDAELLQSIATPGLYALSETTEQVLTNLANLSNSLALRLAANDATISFKVDSSSFRLRDRNIVPDAASVTGDTITWPLIDKISTGQTLSYTFEVEAQHDASAAVGTANATSLACDDEEPSTITIAGPVVQAIAPSPTPLPTATTLPTLTPPPTIMPTVTPPAFVQGSNQATNFTEFSGGGFGLTSTFCAPGFWDWIPWVGALLALILALIFIYRWFQQFQEKKKNEERHWSDYPCLFLKSSAALWGVFLVWLFLLPVVAYICDVPESIYFWRMDGSGTGGIFLTNEYAGPDDDPAQISSINEQGCVGCHTANADAGRVAAIEGGAPGRLLITDLDNDEVGGVQYIGESNAVYVDISPSGDRAAVSTIEGNLIVYDLSGTIPPVTVVPAADGYVAMMPTWNADGLSLAFVRALSAQVRHGLIITGSSEIWVAAVDGSTVQPLVTQDMASGLNYYPSISPNGRWLAFTNHNASEDTYSAVNADIWLADLATLSSGNVNVFPIAGNAPNASDSWPSWDSTGSRLAFNTTRSDPNFDVVTVDVDEDGNTGEVLPLPAASHTGVFEHLPAWGLARERDPLIDQWFALWPMVLPLLGLLLAAWFFCRMRPKVTVDPELVFPPVEERERILEIADLLVWTGIKVLWDPQPTLIVGLGRSGWNVLAQLKNTLIDAGLGEMSDQIRLLAIIPNKQEAMYEEERFNGVLLDAEELIELQDPLNEIVSQGATDESLTWLDTDFVGSGRQLDPREGLRNNRMLGRLALVNNLRGQMRYTQKSIWETLIARADAVKDEGRLNVILVTDTSDDVGSGAALDVAYIIRKIVETQLDVDTLRLTGHFITEAALSGRRDLQDVSRPLNTAAFMRELSRFQLAHGASFDMTYSTDGSSPAALEGTWQQMLFDDVFVHDGHGEQGGAVYSAEPEVGIYPALADSIALWLDTATKEGGFGDWRNNVAQAAELTQYQRGEMVGGAMGIYQYRLPFAEILKEITTRYSRELIHYLLVGESDESTSVPQYSKVDRSAIEPLIKELANLPYLDDYWRAVFDSLLYDEERNLQQALKGLTVDEARDNENWTQLLKYQITKILNGDNSPGDIVLKRSGRLGVAHDYLTYLSKTLLTNHASEVNSFDKGAEASAQLLRFADITTEMLDQLEDAAHKVGIGSASDSLYQELVSDLAAIREREDKRRNLVTRTYITHVGHDTQRPRLTDAWYREYVVEKDALRTGLRQLDWVFNETEGLSLRLVLPSQEDDTQTETLLDITDIEGFKSSLAQLGRYFVRHIRDQVSLSDILGQSILHEDNLNSTSDDLTQLSSVMLRIATQQGLEAMRAGQVLAASREIKQREILEANLSSRSGSLQRLSTTDPFTLTLAQTREVIPLSNVSTIMEVNQTYTQQVYQSRNIQAPVIYDAEARASGYEFRLQSTVETQPHMLHPILTTALAKVDQTISYLLAAAIAAETTDADAVEINWVLQQRQGLQFVNDETGTLELIDARRLSEPRFGNLVDGLFGYIYQVTVDQAREIYEAYEADPDIIAVLERFDRNNGEAWRRMHQDVHPALLEDLISVTRIIINDIG